MHRNKKMHISSLCSEKNIISIFVNLHVVPRKHNNTEDPKKLLETILQQQFTTITPPQTIKPPKSMFLSMCFFKKHVVIIRLNAVGVHISSSICLIV